MGHGFARYFVQSNVREQIQSILNFDLRPNGIYHAVESMDVFQIAIQNGRYYADLWWVLLHRGRRFLPLEVEEMDAHHLAHSCNAGSG